MDTEEIIKHIKNCYEAKESCHEEVIKALIRELKGKNIDTLEFFKQKLTDNEYDYIYPRIEELIEEAI